MIALLLKILALFSFSYCAAQQNPITFTDQITHKWYLASQRPGVTSAFYPKMIQQNDSTEMLFMVPILRIRTSNVSYDSLTFSPPASNPRCVQVLDSATKLVRWTRPDSLIIPKYLLKTDTSDLLTSYLRKHDTTAMLIPYLRKQDTAFFHQALSRNGLTVSLSNGGGSITLPDTIKTFTNSVSRNFTDSFQVSTTQDAFVFYSVDIQVVSTLGGTNSGTVFLEISTGNGTWITLQQAINSINGIISTQINTGNISGGVPKSYWVRLRTAQAGVNGATFTYRRGQEVKF